MTAKQVCRNVLGLATCALFILALGSAPAFAVESTTFPNPNKRTAPEAIKQAPAAQQAPAIRKAPVPPQPPARMRPITDTIPSKQGGLGMFKVETPPKGPSAYPIAPWKGTPGGAPPLPKGVEGMNKAEGMQKVVMPKPGGEGGAIAPSDMPKSGLAYEGIDGESAVGAGGPAAASGAPSSIRGKQQGELGVLVEPKAEP